MCTNATDIIQIMKCCGVIFIGCKVSDMPENMYKCSRSVCHMLEYMYIFCRGGSHMTENMVH